MATIRACVLLVDDERGTFALLQARGFEVSWYTEVRDLIERIGCLADADAGRAVIIAATRLTEACDPPLHLMLQSIGARIPIIALADDADVATAVRAMHAGAVDVLHKPVNVALLSQRIRSARKLNATDNAAC